MMKRLFLLTALTIAATIMACFAQDAPEGSIAARVKGDKVQVRTGPGTDYSVLNELFAFDRGVRILERCGDWYRILPPQGPYFISKDWFEVEDEGLGAVTGNGVFLRSGPGVQFTEVGRLNRGDKMAVVGEHGAWHRVAPAPGMQAWVHANLLEPADEVVVATPDPETDPVTPEPGPDPTTVVVAEPQEVDVPKGIALPGETLTAKLNAFDDLLRREAEKPLEQRDFDQFVQATRFLKAATENLTSDGRARIQVRHDLAGRMHDATRQRQDMLEEHRRRMAQIEEETRRRVAKIEAGRPVVDESRFAAVGVIDRFGLARRLPPITHKLSAAKGVETIDVFLYSDTLDLDRFAGQRVGIVGRPTEIRTYSKPVIEVSGVEVLPPE